MGDLISQIHSITSHIMKDIAARHTFTLIVTIVIIVLSTIPIPEKTPLEEIPFIDKWVHFVMYGGMSLAMWTDLYFIRKERKLSSKFNVFATVYPPLLGGLMEIVQEYLTTCRNGDFIDFIADWFGAILGNIIGLIIFLYLARHAKTQSNKTNTTQKS